MKDSSYSFGYFEKEIRKRKKRISDLEERLEEERNYYQKLIFQKAGWEYRLQKLISDSTQLNIEL
jgi:hypothetical protein